MAHRPLVLYRSGPGCPASEGIPTDRGVTEMNG
jgi:hypothetical protein